MFRPLAINFIIFTVGFLLITGCGASVSESSNNNSNTNSINNSSNYRSSNQDLISRYQYLKSEFLRKYNVNIENLVRYRALRFISAGFWDANKEKIHYLPWMAYGRKTTKKKIIKPDPKVWMFWERGDHFYRKFWNSSIRNHRFTMGDIRELHKNIMDVSIMSKVAVFKKGARPGKIRSRLWQQAPGWNSKCKKYPMREDELNFFLNYDLRTEIGDPLVRVRKFKECKRKPGFYNVKIRYLPSMEVRGELQRLLNYINKRWKAIAMGTYTGITPIEFIADVQRWFVSIHPFGDGNGRVSRIVQDAIAKSFGLPYPPSGYLTVDIGKSRIAYRKDMKEKMDLMVSELEYCMSEHDERAADSTYQLDRDCSMVYSNFGNASKAYSKRVFKNYLDAFLRVPYDDIEDFFKNHPVPKVD